MNLQYLPAVISTADLLIPLNNPHILRLHTRIRYLPGILRTKASQSHSPSSSYHVQKPPSKIPFPQLRKPSAEFRYSPLAGVVLLPSAVHSKFPYRPGTSVSQGGGNRARLPGYRNFVSSVAGDARRSSRARAAAARKGVDRGTQIGTICPSHVCHAWALAAHACLLRSSRKKPSGTRFDAN